MDTEVMIDKFSEMVVSYGPRLVGAILVWIVGSYIIGFIGKGITRMMDKSNLDDSLKPFMRTLSKTLLKILLAVSVLGMIGIEMTSFIAILGAAGLAIGMALSGTLQNFSGGVIILIFKPYVVGDVIEAQGYLGVVKEIQIFNTVLKTFDNKIVVIPNGELSNSSLTNYNQEDTRRVEWIFGIAYGDDYDKAREVITRLASEDEKIHNDPELFIALKELGDSSVNLVVRGWVNTPDVWEVFFRLNEKVYKTFPKEGLNIPFPQMDVHLAKDK